MFVAVEHLGAKCLVDENGKVIDECGVEKKWHYNRDGYPVVSLKGEQGWRSIAVHILVAKAFVSNPDGKPEVNHLDCNRMNPKADNLEWVTHQENVSYSHCLGHYAGRMGDKNPNYGNHTLRDKYAVHPELAKEKQSRPKGRNGRALPCCLFHGTQYIQQFDCQSCAFDWLVLHGVCRSNQDERTVIRHLKSKSGYKGYHLYITHTTT